MQNYDVAIVGAGMVGLTLALALKDSGMKVVVIDGSSIDAPLSEQPELRVSALNLASQQILQQLGAWQYLTQQRLQPYDKMHVWEQDSFAKIDFSASHAGTPELGHIIENQAVRLALLSALQGAANVQLLTETRIKSVAQGQHESFVTLSNDTALTARLLVGADGANSYVRQQANLPLTFWDYEHVAMVATIETELSHGNTARQVFTADGPLALLPLYETNLCSIVWSCSAEQNQKLAKMSDEEFNKALCATSDLVLGRCKVVSKRQSHPLTMRYCRTWVKDRVALIGDAAHTIHPLAGQGANLGMCDAAALAQTIIALHKQGKDFGLATHLRSYERWRKTEATKMIAVMEGFKRLFGGNNDIKKLIRDIGLTLTDKAFPVKQMLIRQAVGLEGDLPELAQKR